jgi:hypothetical protein
MLLLISVAEIRRLTLKLKQLYSTLKPTQKPGPMNQSLLSRRTFPRTVLAFCQRRRWVSATNRRRIYFPKPRKKTRRRLY